MQDQTGRPRLTGRQIACSGLDYDAKLKSNVEINLEKTYLLPDGTNPRYRAERVRFVEVLLQHQFIGQEASEIHGISFHMEGDVDICKDQHANVVSSGGTAMCQWTGERRTRNRRRWLPSR